MEPTTPAPKTPVKRRGIRWRRWLVACAGLILLTEILLRTVFGFAHPILYQTDPACGYLPKPSQNIERFFCLNYLNRYGMRSPEFQMPRPPNTLRLLCIGDSVTYGTTFVPQDQIFTSLLAQSLPDVVHQSVEVLNVSAGGWAPANEFGFLQSRGTFDANLVLFIWNTGDLVQPFNPFNADQNFPTANPSTALGEVWSRYVVPRIFHSATPPPDPGSVASTMSDEQLHANCDLLLQAQTVAADQHAAFALVFVPAPADTFQTPAYEQAHQHFLAFAHDHALPLLDLTTAFHTAGWLSLTKDGIHLQPQGHQVVAAEIAQHFDSLIGTKTAPASTNPK